MDLTQRYGRLIGAVQSSRPTKLEVCVVLVCASRQKRDYTVELSGIRKHRVADKVCLWAGLWHLGDVDIRGQSRYK